MEWYKRNGLKANTTTGWQGSVAYYCYGPIASANPQQQHATKPLFSSCVCVVIGLACV